jgi:hypothetical protein
MFEIPSFFYISPINQAPGQDLERESDGKSTAT